MTVEEAVDAGVEQIGIVIRPGDAEAYGQAVGEHRSRITFVEQDNPRGYGDAILRARDFVAGEPFLHLVGDHLYISDAANSCAKQLVDIAMNEKCAVSAVQPTRENKLPYFGTVGANRIAGRHDLFQIERMIEKPTPTQAEQDLVVAGLRSGYYLCLFGMHVLTPAVMDVLYELLQANRNGTSVTLTDALTLLAQRERMLAYETDGRRFNIGEKYGLLVAQLAVALTGGDRDEILTELVELLASQPSPAAIR
jgi:UTP--glucose-1-phosphate uridylyltransferase